MQRKSIRFPAGFRVGLGNRRSQSATMVIRNTGRVNLATLNFYVPPAYDAQGEELLRGRR
jgi:hypothetical protein